MKKVMIMSLADLEPQEVEMLEEHELDALVIVE